MALFNFSNAGGYSNLRNRVYVPKENPVIIEKPVEKVFTPTTGVYEAEYSYINGQTNKREWDSMELETYLKPNDYCSVLKDAIESMYNKHKEGKDFTITYIKQK